MSNKLRRKGRKNKPKGEGPHYIQLFRYVLNSPAYTSLTAAARSALIEVNHGYNGSNNGRIVLSVRNVAKRMNCANNTAMRALQELVEKGFIEAQVKGSYRVEFRRATEWRLNDRRCNVTGVAPSQAFLKWQNPAPEKAKMLSQKLRPYGLKNEDTIDFGPGPSQYQILRHSTAKPSLKNEDTSISTTCTEPESAAEGVQPDRAELPKDWRRNSKLPDEQLGCADDDGDVPAIPRRTVD